MNDLINRQDVLNLIPQDISDFEEGSCLAYDVGRLPSAQKWIPCSERWPEEYTVVLVSDGEKIGIAYRREYLWYHEEYLGIIAAWMPLPEPYKEVLDQCED